MATLLRAAALAAVVAIAVIGGLQINKLIPDVGESSPSPTAEASPSTTPPVGCVNPPIDISTLIDMVPTGPLDPGVDPVACYGDNPLTFDATWYGGGVADCPAAPEPAWLACSAFSLQAAGDTRKLGAPQLFVAVDPSADLSSISEPYAQVRVTGHFDDPAAQTCRATQSFPGESPEPVAVTPEPVAETIERCRRTFVVTQVAPLIAGDPAVGTLVLRLDSSIDISGLDHVVTVEADGRIITTGDKEATNPFLERRLTAAGIQLLRDELDSTGLTDTSANYVPISKPGVEPPGRGSVVHTLKVGLPAGGPAVISWVAMFADDDLYYEPSPERETLDAMAVRLQTLDDWLPANAWADATAAPYLPARYHMLIQKLEWGGTPDELPVESSAVAWPLETSINDFGEPTESPALGSDIARCGMISADEAAAVINELEAAGARPGETVWTAFELGERANNRLVRITIARAMPDETSCEGGPLPV